MKYAVMTNLWLLAQMRQPGRAIYQDFDRCTFTDFLDTPLGKDNFNFCKEIDGRPMISPCWSFCLSYELELRKEAIRLCKEQAFGIQAALWAALRDKEHRMKHWLQLVAITNTAASSEKQKLQNMRKRIAHLEKARSHYHDEVHSPSSPLNLRFLALRLPPRAPNEAREATTRRRGKERENPVRPLSPPRAATRRIIFSIS